MKITALIKNPFKTANLVWRRVFPFGIKPKDQEAYRIGSWSYGNIKREPITKIFPDIKQTNIKLLNTFQREIGTSLDPTECLILCAITKHLNPKNILEIGTYDGNTALNLAANSPEDSTITTVDLPKDYNQKLDAPDIMTNITDRNIVASQYKNTKYENKIKQIFCDSAKLDYNNLPHFDIIFIDGCHNYNYVKKDTENALNHTKKGGLIIWHDYGMTEDVSKVVDQTSEKIKIKAIRGTRLAIGFV